MANAQKAQAPVLKVPFVSAAHESVELGEVITVTPGTSAQSFQINVPSSGFLRNLVFQVSGAGGTGGTAKEDAPYNIISDITLLDTNGAPIYGPMDGYGMYLSNLFGGTAFAQDPADNPWHVGTTPNFRFALRIPVEISHFNGMGSIGNQNAASPYRLNITINTIANIWSVAPDPVPTFTITPVLEKWTVPNELDPVNRPQEQFPPFHGTTQKWTTVTKDSIAGANTIQVTRTGNLIRGLVFVARNASGVRTDAVFPSPIIFNWDDRQLFNETQLYRQMIQTERLLNGPRPTGVFAYMFNHSNVNKSGDDTPSLWLATVQSTRMEIQGSSGTAGTIQTLVNDIIPVELNPAERYQFRSDTGFTPSVGVPTSGA